MSAPDRDKTAYCHACGAAMDVSQVAPFTSVVCPQCGKHTRVKREFGPYTLVRRYALGGMSVVFLARDNELDREVAVKILNEDFSADEKRIAAFEQEARLTASISHPHVVRLFTTGRSFGRFYIAMEFVSGGHYERKIRDGGALPEKDVLEVAMQVADGLRAALASGLIHRDIKPGNILFDDQGNAKIVDFGLALVLHGGSAKAEELWATPYYVPPEAIEGRPEDFRSDIYAFGATFYHALAGKPPCSEESMSTPKLREAKQKVVPLELAAPWLGLETCKVIDKAMAYEARGRFQSYEELIDALELAMRHAKAGAGRAGVPGAKGARRAVGNSGKFGVAAALVALVFGLGFAGWWLAREKPEAGDGGASTEETGFPGGETGSQKANPEDEIRVGRNYKAARRDMEAGNYKGAEQKFARLLGDPSAPEPTATICGVESAIAALLDGRPGDAREQVAGVISHISKLPPDATGSEVRRLGIALQKVGKLRPVHPDRKDLKTSSDILRAMLFGLKDWEQGCIKEAVGWFRKVASVPEDNEWAAVYRKLAADYLADAKVLEENDFDALPANLETCRKLEKQLAEARGKLKTRGRAMFNLRQRSLFLARHTLALEEKAQSADHGAPAVSFEKLLPEIKKLIAASRFAEARKALAAFKPADSGELIRRDAWLYLVGSAADFLAEISKDLAGATLEIEMTTRDGKTWDRVAGVAKTGGLMLAAGGEDPVPVAWSKIEPPSVIALHKHLVGLEKDTAVKLHRHEDAIAYDFLVGDRQHAEAAAERLGQTSPKFQERWEEAMHGVD